MKASFFKELCRIRQEKFPKAWNWNNLLAGIQVGECYRVRYFDAAAWEQDWERLSRREQALVASYARTCWAAPDDAVNTWTKRDDYLIWSEAEFALVDKIHLEDLADRAASKESSAQRTLLATAVNVGILEEEIDATPSWPQLAARIFQVSNK